MTLLDLKWPIYEFNEEYKTCTDTSSYILLQSLNTLTIGSIQTALLIKLLYSNNQGLNLGGPSGAALLVFWSGTPSCLRINLKFKLHLTFFVIYTDDR